MKKKILLTGSTGMVGQNILSHKNADSYKFIAPPRKKLDLLDNFAVDKFLKKENPYFIIHAAGIVGGIHKNLREPIKFLTENVQMGKNLIMSAYKNNIRRIINLSSSCIYPPKAKNPLKENQIMNGKFEKSNEAYAYSKVFNHLLCNYIITTNKQFQYKTLVPCNLFGEYDNFDSDSSHLIASIILKINKAIRNKQKIVKIWGDGMSKREFMFARDFADFIFFSLKNFSKIPNVMNVGIGKDYRIKEYYHIIKKVLNWDGNFIYDLSKPTGQKRKLVNIDIQNKLQWYPKYKIEDSIRITNNFFLKNEKNYN